VSGVWFGCQYEEAIEAAGALQLAFTGVDEDGTIGCNEPGSSLLSKTRAKTMAYSRAAVLQPKFERTSSDNHFSGVPTTCLTMGIDTLMKARQVFVIFSGHGRSQCLQQALEGGVSHMCPVSAFQQHDGCTCIADENATADLKMKTVHYFKGTLTAKNMSALSAAGDGAGWNVPNHGQQDTPGQMPGLSKRRSELGHDQDAVVTKRNRRMSQTGALDAHVGALQR
jgi:hypothetical protein